VEFFLNDELAIVRIIRSTTATLVRRIATNGGVSNWIRPNRSDELHLRFSFPITVKQPGPKAISEPSDTLAPPRREGDLSWWQELSCFTPLPVPVSPATSIQIFLGVQYAFAPVEIALQILTSSASKHCVKHLSEIIHPLVLKFNLNSQFSCSPKTLFLKF